MFSFTALLFALAPFLGAQSDQESYPEYDPTQLLQKMEKRNADLSTIGWHTWKANTDGKEVDESGWLDPTLSPVQDRSIRQQGENQFWVQRTNPEENRRETGLQSANGIRTLVEYFSPLAGKTAPRKSIFTIRELNSQPNVLGLHPNTFGLRIPMLLYQADLEDFLRISDLGTEPLLGNSLRKICIRYEPKNAELLGPLFFYWIDEASSWLIVRQETYDSVATIETLQKQGRIDRYEPYNAADEPILNFQGDEYRPSYSWKILETAEFKGYELPTRVLMSFTHDGPTAGMCIALQPEFPDGELWPKGTFELPIPEGATIVDEIQIAADAKRARWLDIMTLLAIGTLIVGSFATRKFWLRSRPAKR